MFILYFIFLFIRIGVSSSTREDCQPDIRRVRTLNRWAQKTILILNRRAHKTVLIRNTGEHTIKKFLLFYCRPDFHRVWTLNRWAQKTIFILNR